MVKALYYQGATVFSLVVYVRRALDDTVALSSLQDHTDCVFPTETEWEPFAEYDRPLIDRRSRTRGCQESFHRPGQPHTKVAPSLLRSSLPSRLTHEQCPVSSPERRLYHKRLAPDFHIWRGRLLSISVCLLRCGCMPSQPH